MDICLIAAAAASVLTTRVTPINSAEAVFAPFWDWSLREALRWECSAGKISHSWCETRYSWNGRPGDASKPAFEAVRTSPFSCEGYDTFIYTGIVPPKAKLRIELETDCGIRSAEWTGRKSWRDEYLMPLDGAKKIRKIVFQVFDTGKNRIRAGTFLWMGLQNSRELERLLERQKRFAEQPLDVFLAPPGTVPSFKGKVNLLAPPAELKKIQAAYLERKKELGEDFYSDPKLKKHHPEKLLTETLPFANPRQFGRLRDDGRGFLPVRRLIARAVVAKDALMLEKAVRTAVVIALTPNWDSMFLSAFPDSGWDQRVFSHAAAANAVALALDYGHDLLSPAGRNLLRKRLALEGLGQINYNIWTYEYLFGTNQLAAFTQGRIAAYLVLEKASGWNGSRIKAYTDLAIGELLDSIDKLFYEDGSFMEGVPYFGYTVRNIRPSLEMYAAARKKPLSEVVPAKMKNLGNFADVFISTDRRGGMIPVCAGQGDGRYSCDAEACQFLAILAPESQWVTLYRKQVETPEQLWKCDLSAIARHSQVPQGPVKVKPLSVLPTMGMMASTRFFEGAPVKILLLGAKAGKSDKQHNDRGSFVLEFAGDTYAADPGGQSYGDAEGHQVIRSDYHNMLVPGKMPDDEPRMTAKKNVYPAGSGDETSFQAEIRPAPFANKYFAEWKRTISSPVPNQIIFRDDYRLNGKQKSVRFLWITRLPWTKVKDGVIRLDGQDSYALIHYPADMQFYPEKLVVRQKDIYHRLNFEKTAPDGTIVIKAELFRKVSDSKKQSGK